MNSIHLCRTNSVWCADAVLKESAQYFGATEKKRILKLSSKRKAEFAISRLLLRTGLSYTFGQPVSDWNLIERKNNAPRVNAHNWNGFISITHSKHFVACAISDQIIGVDIEEPRVIHQLNKVVKRIFTPAQQDRLQSAASTQRQQLFLQLWTEKEALFKAHSNANSPIQFMSTDSLEDIGLHTNHISSNRFVGSLASKHPIDQFNVYFWRSPQQSRKLSIKPNATSVDIPFIGRLNAPQFQTN